MFRYLYYLILVAIALALVVICLANLQTVTLRSIPDGLTAMPGSGMVNYSIELPLFIVILIGVAIGLLIGFVWEWLREMKIRSYAAREHKEKVQLKRELTRVKGKQNEGKDEVLALIEDT